MCKGLESGNSLGCSGCGGSSSVTAWWSGKAQTRRGQGRHLVVQVLIKPLFRSGIFSVFSRRPLKFSMGELHALSFGLNTDLNFHSLGVFPGALAASGLWVSGSSKPRCAGLRTHALGSGILGFRSPFYHLLAV